jgi:hypothetical protein
VSLAAYQRLLYRKQDVQYVAAQLGRKLQKHFGGGPVILQWATLHGDGNIDVERHCPLLIAKGPRNSQEPPIKIYVPGSMPLSKLRKIALEAVYSKNEPQNGDLFGPSGDSLQSIAARCPNHLDPSVDELGLEV